MRIIGIGNPLMADDGIGPAVIDVLQATAPALNAELIDGGLGGLALLPCFEGTKRVILVDAADLGQPPGSVAVLHPQPEDLSAAAGALSGHGGGLEALLAMVAALEYGCEISVVAVQPQRLEPHIGLSAAARRGVAAAVAAVATLLADPDDSAGIIRA